MEPTQEALDGLWGDGGPYSQVQVIREVRILDEAVSRTFHYVKANVNPTTHAVLQARAREIEDPEIQDFLRGATFISEEDGYEWVVYGKQAQTPRGANQAAEEATAAVIRMHRLVREAFGLPAPRQQGEDRPGPDEPPRPPGDRSGARPAGDDEEA